MKFLPGADGNNDERIDLTAMLDVVFNLLLFFMVTTVFIQAPGLKVDLPKTQTQDGSSTQKDTIISIDVKGQIAFRDRILSIDNLKDELTNLPRSTVMVLRADTHSTHGRVVEVMDLIKDLGFTDLAIATEPKKGT